MQTLALLITGDGPGTATDGQLRLIDDRGFALGLRIDRVDGLITVERGRAVPGRPASLRRPAS